MTILQAVIASESAGAPPPPPPPTSFDYGMYPEQDSGGAWSSNGSFLGYSSMSTVQPDWAGTSMPNGQVFHVFNFTGNEWLATPNLNTPTGSWQSNTITIDMWFWPTANGTMLLAELSNDPNQDGSPNFGWYTSVLEIDSSGYLWGKFWDAQPGQYLKSHQPVVLNRWNHIYFCEDAQGGHIFELNGVASDARIQYIRQSPTLNGGGVAERFVVGATTVTSSMNKGTARYQGMISWMEIHDYQYPSQFLNRKSIFKPLLTMVHLDANDMNSYAGDGIYWGDLSGRYNPATLINTPTFVTGNGSTTPNYFEFARSSLQYANIANIGDLQRWSYEVWLNTTEYLSATDATAALTTVYDDPLVGHPGVINFCLGNNRATTGNPNMQAGFYDAQGDGWHETAGIVPIPGEWAHFTGTYDGTTIKLYKNGVLQSGQLAYTGYPQAAGGAVRIARRWDGPEASQHYFPGKIGYVRIYENDLTQAEVTEAYNNQKTRYGL